MLNTSYQSQISDSYILETDLQLHSTKNIHQVITFNLNNEWYAIDIKEMKEIVSNTCITSLPATLYGIEGIINLRGRVVSVINLKKYLHMKVTNYPKNHAVIILQNGKQLKGILVDEIKEVSPVAKNNEAKVSSCSAKLMFSIYILGSTSTVSPLVLAFMPS